MDNYHSELVKIFKAYRVLMAYLFGSQATGRNSPLSDIDIAVLFDEKVEPHTYMERQMDLIGEFMKLFHTNDVDVVGLNNASPLLTYNVVSRSKVLFDPRKRALRFKISAWNRFFDSQYLRDVQWSYLRKWIAERRKHWKKDKDQW